MATDEAAEPQDVRFWFKIQINRKCFFILLFYSLVRHLCSWTNVKWTKQSIHSSIHHQLFSFPKWQCGVKPKILLEVVAAVPIMLVLLPGPKSYLHCLSFLVKHLLHVPCKPLHQAQPVHLLHPHCLFKLLVFLKDKGQTDSVRSKPTWSFGTSNLFIFKNEMFKQLRIECMTCRDEEEMQTLITSQLWGLDWRCSDFDTVSGSGNKFTIRKNVTWLTDAPSDTII